MALEVIVEADGPILTITLNRPRSRNAINLAVCKGVADAIAWLESDPKLRVGILTGAGTVFCAGADLREADLDGALAINNFEPGGFAGLVRAQRRKPLIGAAQGSALAGGFEILLACELVVAAESASFGLPEVGIGIMAAAGGVIALARQLPFPQAMKLLLTGEPIGASEAFRLGLITEVAPVDKVMERARSLAMAIASAAPRSVECTLHLARLTRAGAADGVLQTVNDDLIQILLAEPDSAEGRRAFFEKRKPQWSGNS